MVAIAQPIGSQPVPQAPAISAGGLPAWEVAELPAPPKFNFRNALAIVGPGAILLGVSIGSGEWLIGPAVTAKYGGALLWVAGVSIILQVVMNMEFIRYTMYTGEPVYSGFMRTKPGSTFWGWVYALLVFAQVGWPGWAAAAATALGAAFLGRLPEAADAGMVNALGAATFIVCIAIVAVGGKVERTMERVQWFFIAWIVLYLLVVGLLFVPFGTWAQVGQGFVSFGSLPEGADWFLLAGFAAYAGAGGVINAAISNWTRDKGIGMGSVVGFIPSIVGGKKISVSHTGKVFEPTAASLRNWHEWWKYMALDQYGVWTIGAFLGMALPALLTVQFVPPGTDIAGQAVAAFQAKYLAERAGAAMWFLTLLCGFWILFSTQLGIVDGFSRMMTDMIWTGSGRVRGWRGGDIRYLYYGVVLAISLFGILVFALRINQPLLLIQMGAFAAGLNFVVLGIHVLVINRMFLPRALRPALWRELVVIAAVLFFAFFTIVTILSHPALPFKMKVTF